MKRLRTILVASAPLLIILTFLIGVLLWMGLTRPPQILMMYPGTNVACLPDRHTNIALTRTMHLSITVDGVAEEVPANIGNTLDCLAELHTHRNDGTIYAEFYDPKRVDTLTLADFFTVWQQPLDREGYTLAITYNGAPVASPANIPLADGGQILFAYTKVTQ